jgi:TATA-box binding protein (TBP) (component of TFIID and TFIIIB)
MISNINYKGRVTESVNHLLFSIKPPQFVQKCEGYTLVIFKTGKCRIMGCKKPLDLVPSGKSFIPSMYVNMPYRIEIDGIQSITVTANLNKMVHLYKLAAILKEKCMFEPELFGALRYLKYNPLCVNIFSSGKIVMLGLKTLDYKHLVDDILIDISNLM